MESGGAAHATGSEKGNREGKKLLRVHEEGALSSYKKSESEGLDGNGLGKIFRRPRGGKGREKGPWVATRGRCTQSKNSI